MSRRIIAVSCFALLLVSAYAQVRTLFAYVGTGIKDPVLELAQMYEDATGVKVEMTFNNSGSPRHPVVGSQEGRSFSSGKHLLRPQSGVARPDRSGERASRSPCSGHHRSEGESR